MLKFATKMTEPNKQTNKTYIAQIVKIKYDAGSVLFEKTANNACWQIKYIYHIRIIVGKW